MDLIAIYLTNDFKVSGRGLFKGTNVVFFQPIERIANIL